MTDTDAPETYTVKHSEGTSTVEGWMLASVTSREDEGQKAQFFTDLDLYRSKSGKFIVVRRTVRPGVDQTQLKVFATREDAQEWLGYGALSLMAYEDAGWPI